MKRIVTVASLKPRGLFSQLIWRFLRYDWIEPSLESDVFIASLWDPLVERLKIGVPKEEVSK